MVVIVGVLVLAAFGFATYFLLAAVLPRAAAAALVAFVYLAIAGTAWWYAWRMMQGAGGILLPRTRQMISEMMQWRDHKESNNS